MTATSFPSNPAAVIDATKASSRTAAIVSELCRVNPAGPPMPADRAHALGHALKDELYSSHVARWEYRHKDDVGPACWMQADAAQVCYANTRGLVIRALFEKPRVPQPEKEHVFQNRTCTVCGDPEDWAGPDCMPPAPPVDPRSRLPFDPRWMLQPLQWLRDAGPIALNRFDREHRSREAAFLFEQLEAFIKECEKP
ncbi:hypothetical protein DBR33_23720 [Stenotrophomonas sp. HMWF022]|nr:hypothetical protein DBR20_11845 [Stenotrophomonas sp. HMWF023]PTT34102.1 hypothetical protein DBR33_23720 [Stenotrophomonas sp. HMWF022]